MWKTHIQIHYVQVVQVAKYTTQRCLVEKKTWEYEHCGEKNLYKRLFLWELFRRREIPERTKERYGKITRVTVVVEGRVGLMCEPIRRRGVSDK